MKKIFVAMMAAAILFSLSSCNKKYERVSGDPLKARIYTLDNGLKVYMSVNKQTPRIQTYIAVRSGSKNDPSDNTGLAHYLEHLMFKGTPNFGTSDYSKEKPMLDQIEQLYQLYRTKTDDAERAAIYHKIDSISYEASKIAIPNEYDKLMSIIGSQNSNAFTSNDETVYQEDIPSNQIDNWAKIQSDRFKNMVIRGFHTELEAVYEEKNMSLTDDMEKSMVAIDSILFKNHPYGSQTVLGTQDHLKNPSITAIKKQKDTYYVPNNVAICVSGDFKPEEMLAAINKYFGDWKPNPNLPKFEFKSEAPIKTPVIKTVYGAEAPFTMISWRYPGESNPESDIAKIAGPILSNGMAGLIDIDLAQQQKILRVGCFPYGRPDYGEMLLIGYPKEGQSLEQVKDLLLQEVDKLRKGNFDDKLITAIVNNIKLDDIRNMESNDGRAMAFVNSFINGSDWKRDVKMIDRLSKITKNDIMDWANKYLAANNYACVVKQTGTDNNIKKISAPKITPIVTNRDKQSSFLKDIQSTKVTPIEPVFVDYKKDMSTFDFKKGINVLYKKNVNDDIAEVNFIFNEGSLSDASLPMAFEYASYLGTPTRSAKEIASQMYSLACSFNMDVSDNKTTISISGLSENLGKAIDIVEDLIANAKPDEKILSTLKEDNIKKRSDAKMNQSSCNNALDDYIEYGPAYIKQTTLTNDQVRSINSKDLLKKVSKYFSLEHTILFYGPQSESKFKSTLSSHHKTANKLEPLKLVYPQMVVTKTPQVFLAQYDARQFYYEQFSNRGEKFDFASCPQIRLFNEYFGGGMNTIVFQEMREARALAYSAYALLQTPKYKDGSYYFYATIASQNDKLKQAVDAFDLIINDMPESEKAFNIAKNSIVNGIRTNRILGMQVLRNYMRDKELGISESREKLTFEKVQKMTLADLKATQQKWIKGRTYNYGILGDIKDLDMTYLNTLGPVKVVSPEEIFGY
jgi:predicted Zn-dependent peptidase